MKMKQNSRGTWRYDIPANESPTGARLRGSTGTRDKSEALRHVNRLLAGDTPKMVEGMTLRQACDKALREVWHGHKSLQFFTSSCAVICEALGDHLSLDKVNRTELARLKAKLLARGNAGSTVNRRLAVLSRLLTWAAEEGVIQAVPKIGREREAAGRSRVYTPVEEDWIIDYWFEKGDMDMWRLVKFMFATGCRPSEALNLNPQTDLLADHCVIFRDTKNGRERTLQIDEQAWNMARMGFPFRNTDQVAKRWSPCREALGLGAECTVYVIRHTVATRLLQGGLDPVRVQKWMGHTKIETTLRYLHLTTKDTEGGREVLSMTKTVTNQGQTPGEIEDNRLITGDYSDC